MKVSLGPLFPPRTPCWRFSKTETTFRNSCESNAESSMTSLSLQYANHYWEDRLRKESLAASMHEGAPHHDQHEMHRFLAADREGTRGNWTMHRTKSRASLAWQEYAHGKNPITGYDTRYRHDRDLPFFPPRSPEARRPATSTATDAFPSEPRMRCARGGTSNHICCAERAPQA